MKSGYTETTSDDKRVVAPVNRTRRSRFVFIVVGFCLIASVAIVFKIDDTATANTAIQGLLSLATFLAMTYVGASSVDYNGGIRNMFSQDNQRDSGQYYGRPSIDRRRRRVYAPPDDDAVG